MALEDELRIVNDYLALEQVRFEDGRSALKSWDDYPILRFTDIPKIEIELIDNPKSDVIYRLLEAQADAQCGLSATV